MTLTENLYLRQEYHSIIPFLLLNSKSLHRMCLSDYEIKLVIKMFKKRSKLNRLECFDYYKIGIINFFKGNYVNAFNNFKKAYNMKLKDNIDSSGNNNYNNNNNYYSNNNNNQNNKKIIHQNFSNGNCGIDESSIINISNSNNIIANIAKWLCFSGMILIFCNTNKHDSFNKIDFKNITKIKLEDFDYEERTPFIFDCCSVRKKGKIGENLNEEDTKKSVKNLLKSKNTISLSNNLLKIENSFVGSDLSLIKHDLNSIAKEIEDLLKIVIDNEKNKVEGNWLSMIISLYCNANKNTKIFKQFLEPKCYIKAIKNCDNYLSYIVYTQMMYFTQEDFKIEYVLNELIQKFKYRLEAYFFYWNLLYKGKYRNHNEANSLTEVLLKITSVMKFDENNIYL
jgi:hypothetical protein